MINTESEGSTGTKEPSQDKNDIIEALEHERRRNAELTALLAYERQENDLFKIRRRNLTEKMNSVNGWLERNVQSYFTLYEDTKNALHMGRSTLLSASESLPSSKPGPSGTVTVKTRRKIYIEKLPMKNLEKSLEDEVQETSKSSQTPQTNSTIIKGSSRIVLKELKVQLTRLPDSVVQNHLGTNELSICSDTSLNLAASTSTSRGPEFTSTPSKLETLRGIGLYPIGLLPVNNFVTVRRNRGSSNVCQVEEVKKSPLKTEDRSPHLENHVENSTPNSCSSTSHKTLNNTAVSRSPKVRRARPQQMKEPSLRKKMRR